MPTPRATLRIQLRPQFDFAAASEVADYLAALGVSHFYASPYLQAAPGSAHGYDVVDPTRVNEELGGESGHRRLIEALERHGLGQVLDIVPNHMSVAAGNPWWWDVLRNGPASAYAHIFDVDWDPPEPKLRNQVLMPILGDHYGRELEAGHLRLSHHGGEFTLHYHDHTVPVAPRSLAPVVDQAAKLVRAPATEVSPADELAFLARSLRRLPDAATDDAGLREARRRDLAVIDHRLRTLVREPGVNEALAGVVEEVNGDVEALDALISEQNYRLAYWRTAGQELDYRRFFDIDTLAAIRTEDPHVFDAVHGRVLEWVREGVLDGLRVDHPDGLRLPSAYFRRLREAAPDAWIVVEKILMPDESLRSWPVDGTTGYDFLNTVMGVFVDPAGEVPFTETWRRLTGDRRSFHDVALEAREDILRDVLGADLNRLANVFVQVCEARRRYRDFTRDDLREALGAVAAVFPVYRAYVTESGAAEDDDREVVYRAVRSALARRPELDPELLALLRDVLLGEVAGDEARGLRMRFQQLTGPVAAKGEEDTAFYRYLRFSALNEVGGDPGRWGMAPSEFHERCRSLAEEWPRNMTSLSTHDTKRSEDVRARLLVLPEIPDRWTAAVERWQAMNARHWPSDVERDPAMEYLLYQSMVGAWPIDADRLVAYMEKASREAKLRTSWTDPDTSYDEALASFVRSVRGSEEFVRDLAAFAERLVGPGRVVSLAQKLVQLTAPGVPDLYQGTDLWDLSLVDPDNRRPVDWAERRRLLEWLEPRAGVDRSPGEILDRMDEGVPKLWVVRQALRLRAERPHAFVGASYEPLELGGPTAEHGLGFVRDGEVAVLVPRLVLGLVRRGGWGETVVYMPPGRWRNVLTGETLDVSRGEGHAMGNGVRNGTAGGTGSRTAAVEVERALGRFPVGLFSREGGEVE